MRMVSDRVLTPFLLQMALYSTLDSTERTLGWGSFAVRGQVEFQGGGVVPLRLDNAYSGDFNVPLQASLGVAAPLAYALGAGFDALKVKNIELEVVASEQRHTLQVDQVTASRRVVRPGESVELAVTLTGENGAEIVRKVRYATPIGLPPGPLLFTVADALTTNTTNYQQAITTPSKSPAQIVTLLNSFRANTKACVRVWRADASFQVQGQELPDPPPSLSLMLAKDATALGTAWPSRGATIDELEIDVTPGVAAGSKTVQVEVKE
jgi:hypothetical protein